MSRPIAILFVDDEPKVLKAIERSLATAACEVLTAPGAREALAILDARPVDLLVSDIDMPGMSGLELVKLARARHPATIRMLLTGRGTLEKAIASINEGEVLRFFTKPFDVRLFRRTLLSLVERIDRLRREGVERAREARRAQLLAWMAARFPGSTEVARDERGELILDGDRLARAVRATGSAAALALLEEK